MDERDHVRFRPGMYFGSPDAEGAAHMFWEVFGNAVDLSLRGQCRSIEVATNGRRVTVTDDGPGFSIARDAVYPCSFLEASVTHMHSSPSRDGHQPHVHLRAGFHGNGLAPVNFLCLEFQVEVRQEGRAYALRCRDGRVVDPLHEVGPAEGQGTRISYLPDPKYFPVPLDVTGLGERLQDLAFLNPGLRLTYNGRVLDGRKGLAGLCAHYAGDAPWVTDPVVLSGLHEQVTVDVALLWTRGLHVLKSYMGMLLTVDPGTHVEGLWQGLNQVFGPRLPKPVYREGLVAVVHVDLAHPTYAGPTKACLISPEVLRAVRRVVGEGLSRHTASDPTLVQYLETRRREGLSDQAE